MIAFVLATLLVPLLRNVVCFKKRALGGRPLMASCRAKQLPRRHPGQGLCPNKTTTPREHRRISPQRAERAPDDVQLRSVADHRRQLALGRHHAHLTKRNASLARTRKVALGMANSRWPPVLDHCERGSRCAGESDVADKATQPRVMARTAVASISGTMLFDAVNAALENI